MIVFDLDCSDCGSRFESWFASSGEYDHLAELSLLICAACGSASVRKAPMAPSVARKSSQSSVASLAKLQGAMLEDSRWVGDRFVETARAMHLGEADAEKVHGQATLGEARDLIAEGVPVLPLPLPVVPPTQVN
jgi:hypothetical protein